jgi:hypothetical protein
VPESAVKLWTSVLPCTSDSASLKNAKLVKGAWDTCLHCEQWHVSWKIGPFSDLNRKPPQVHVAIRGVGMRKDVPVRPNVRAKLPAEEADDRPRRDDGNASPERPGIGCRSGSA